MIEIIQEYWKSLLWTDGYRFTGVAITHEVADLFCGNGASGGVSGHRSCLEQGVIQFPSQLFTYIFRGTPLYVNCWFLLRHV